MSLENTPKTKKPKVSAGATFEFEQKLATEGYQLIIGTDEVGRGPLAGSVVAAAVCLQAPGTVLGQPLSKEWELIKDSKKLSEKQRESLFDFIHAHFYVGVGICDHHTIDRINILEASFLAMKKAVQELTRNVERGSQNDTRYAVRDMRTIVLVDGNKKIPNFSQEQLAIVGGDNLVKSIAAASIIAKVTRDRMMAEAHAQYPLYGFDKHKGYGTKFHMDSLMEHGPCPIHRVSFAPVRKALLRG